METANALRMRAARRAASAASKERRNAVKRTARQAETPQQCLARKSARNSAERAARQAESQEQSAERKSARKAGRP